MTADSSSPRLPTELVIEIFRKKVLSRTDLYRCALVSRRYLRAVQRLLYAKVHVLVAQRPHYAEDGAEDGSEDSEEEEDRVKMEFSKQSWQLLTTLLEEPALAQLVKVVRVGRQFFDSTSDTTRLSNVETTPLLAFSTFLHRLPNTTTICFECNLDPLLKMLKITASRKGVNALSVNSPEPEQLEYIVRRFPDLKHLVVCSDQSARWSQDLKGPANLETLRFRGDSTVPYSPILFASSSTLRLLRIDIDFAVNLVYSHFPLLQELEVYSIDSHRRPVRSRANPTFQKFFWPHLCASPSLVTISFTWSATRPLADDSGFSSIFGGDPAFPKRPIPTLRTIRFGGTAINLDRVKFLLASPLAETIQRISVPSRLALSGKPRSRKDNMELKAIVAMCEGTGIEVYLADD